jgi:hypothetical protein
MLAGVRSTLHLRGLADAHPRSVFALGSRSSGIAQSSCSRAHLQCGPSPALLLAPIDAGPAGLLADALAHLLVGAGAGLAQLLQDAVAGHDDYARGPGPRRRRDRDDDDEDDRNRRFSSYRGGNRFDPYGYGQGRPRR